MSLVLAVESSSGVYSVAIGTAEGKIARRVARRDEPGFAGLGKMVDLALADLGSEVADLYQLAVDIGPGNLSSVRAAVAYVDGLAFSAGLQIFCVNSLELLAAEYSRQASLPVLCLRKGHGGSTYLGLYRGLQPIRLAFAELRSTVLSLCGPMPDLAVAGGSAAAIAAMLPDTNVIDAGLAHPDVDVLLQMASES